MASLARGLAPFRCEAFGTDRPEGGRSRTRCRGPPLCAAVPSASPSASRLWIYCGGRGDHAIGLRLGCGHSLRQEGVPVRRRARLRARRTHRPLLAAPRPLRACPARGAQCARPARPCNGLARGADGRAWEHPLLACGAYPGTDRRQPALLARVLVEPAECRLHQGAAGTQARHARTGSQGGRGHHLRRGVPPSPQHHGDRPDDHRRPRRRTRRRHRPRSSADRRELHLGDHPPDRGADNRR